MSNIQAAGAPAVRRAVSGAAVLLLLLIAIGCSSGSTTTTAATTGGGGGGGSGSGGGGGGGGGGSGGGGSGGGSGSGGGGGGGSTTTTASSASTTTSGGGGGGGGDLLAGVPTVDGNKLAQDNGSNGSVHVAYQTTASPSDVVSKFQSGLQSNGWNVSSTGGGGFGGFGGGGLTATNPPRYLSMNAGGGNGQTFVDVCVWPNGKPSNESCGNSNNNN